MGRQACDRGISSAHVCGSANSGYGHPSLHRRADRKNEFPDHSDSGTESPDPENVRISWISGAHPEKSTNHESDTGWNSGGCLPGDQCVGMADTDGNAERFIK